MEGPSNEAGRPGLPDLEMETTYVRLDPSGLRHRLKSLPEQCWEAWQRGIQLTPPGDWKGINRIVLGGMGGSAIAGDLVADLAASQGAVPVAVLRDFRLPYRLDRSCLFIACSHSGSTEETLSLFRQARQQRVPLLVMAGGGPLAQEATVLGIPVLSIESPGEPRSAVGYNLLLLTGALDQCGLVSTGTADVEEAMTVLRDRVGCWAEDVPEERNLAKQVARELVGRLVLVCGGGLFTGMSRRWKTQLNENAKAWAFYEPIPELLHNSVEAFGSGEAASQGKMVLVLKPDAESKELGRRYAVLCELLKQNKIAHRVLGSDPGPALAQQLSMLVLGDYVSYYLALLQGMDPSPTPTLELGKSLLREDS